MAQTQPAEPAPVDSNPKATGGVTGKGFQPGQSGNPGGRPKGLASTVRDVVDGDDLARFWAACMTGVLETTVFAHDEWKRDKAGRLRKRHVAEHTTRETVEIKDRIAVSKLLAERGWGKPPQFVPMEADDPLEFGDREADEMAAEFDGKLGDIEAKRREREQREASPA